MLKNKLIPITLSAVLALGILTSCGEQKQPAATEAPKATAQSSTSSKSLEELTARKDYITINVNVNGESKVMKGELYPDLAPITVANFEKLASEGFYEGLIFHRVIAGFMIQGGGYDENMQEKDAESIKGEFKSNGVENPLPHTKGVLSMARTNVPDSASSQFFIMHDDAPHLDGEYAAFGKITEGLEVIDEIAASQTETLPNGMSDVPASPIVIESMLVAVED